MAHVDSVMFDGISCTTTAATSFSKVYSKYRPTSITRFDVDSAIQSGAIYPLDQSTNHEIASAAIMFTL